MNTPVPESSPYYEIEKDDFKGCHLEGGDYIYALFWLLSVVLPKSISRQIETWFNLWAEQKVNELYRLASSHDLSLFLWAIVSLQFPKSHIVLLWWEFTLFFPLLRMILHVSIHHSQLWTYSLVSSMLTLPQSHAVCLFPQEAFPDRSPCCIHMSNTLTLVIFLTIFMWRYYSKTFH